MTYDCYAIKPNQTISNHTKTTPGQSWSGSIGYEGVLYTLHISRTGSSPSDEVYCYIQDTHFWWGSFKSLCRGCKQHILQPRRQDKTDFYIVLQTLLYFLGNLCCFLLHLTESNIKCSQTNLKAGCETWYQEKENNLWSFLIYDLCKYYLLVSMH